MEYRVGTGCDRAFAGDDGRSAAIGGECDHVVFGGSSARDLAEPGDGTFGIHERIAESIPCETGRDGVATANGDAVNMAAVVLLAAENQGRTRGESCSEGRTAECVS